MKVFIVFFIPDYIGIEIVKIFDNQDDAVSYVKKYNSSHPMYDQLDWFEDEVKHGFEFSD